MAIIGGFWKKFLSLIPQEQQYVGTVSVVGTLGRYTLDRDDGNQSEALSPESYTVGAKVFVTGRKIDGPAPSLTDLGTLDV